jgi:signal transduction histidine kinase
MQHNRLFNRTRWQLTGFYAGVIGLMLGLGAFATHQMMVQAFWRAVDRELEIVAGTLHDSLEATLETPGVMEPSVVRLLPGMCIRDNPCPTQTELAQHHVLGLVQQQGYYVRFLNRSGHLVAKVGAVERLPLIRQQQYWQTLTDSQNNRYHQISIPLKTKRWQPWGTMQVGRSLKEFDADLTALRFILLAGLPFAMLSVAGASWWLAGRAMKPIYQSYERIQQFTVDAAHELRTPLAATRTAVELSLRQPTLPEAEARSTLQIVERQINRLSQLAQDLLLLSRLDIQGVADTRTACCVNDVIADLEEELASLALAADVNLSVKNTTSEPVYVRGNEGQIYRLFTNLIVNAIQHTQGGGSVTVNLHRDRHSAIIAVEDTGIGITPANQTRIFERFYRVGDDRSRQTGGSGLGLAIAQVIVLAHEGTIQVSSELGKGSTFIVRLPLVTLLNRQDKMLLTPSKNLGSSVRSSCTARHSD